jgi:hypothetical protein
VEAVALTTPKHLLLAALVAVLVKTAQHQLVH